MRIFQSWWLPSFPMGNLFTSVPLPEGTGDKCCLEDKNLHIQEVQQTLLQVQIKLNKQVLHGSRWLTVLSRRPPQSGGWGNRR